MRERIVVIVIIMLYVCSGHFSMNKHGDFNMAIIKLVAFFLRGWGSGVRQPG